MDNIVTVTHGQFHSMAIKTDGSLWVWGGHGWGEISHGIMGNGTIFDSPTPIRIKEDVVAIGACALRSFAITSDGGLWAWGADPFAYRAFAFGAESFLYPVRIMENVMIPR